MGLSDLVPYLVIAGQLLILFKVFSTFYLQVLLSPQGDSPPALSDCLLCRWSSVGCRVVC